MGGLDEGVEAHVVVLAPAPGVAAQLVVDLVRIVLTECFEVDMHRGLARCMRVGSGTYLAVPVANLHQREAFIPYGYAAWWAFGLTLAGWLLAAVVVAGLTGVFKRD